MLKKITPLWHKLKDTLAHLNSHLAATTKKTPRPATRTRSTKPLNASPQHLAEQFGLPIYKTLATTTLPRELYKKVPYAFVKRHTLLPFAEEDTLLLVAIADPLNLEPLDELRLLLEREVKAVYCDRNIIIAAINECYHKGEETASEVLAHLDTQNDDPFSQDQAAIYDLLDDAGQAPIVKLLNLIIKEGIQQGVSDIHFEPFEDDLRIRYRVDGVLQTHHAPSQEYQSQMLTRLKVMAKLDIAEHRLPQDGRIKLRMGNREIDIRVSTVPIANGERIVMRILDKGNISLGLDKIGMPPALLQQFRRLITLSEGIVLVTGPTGSGKTTTLYSAIHERYSDEINIMTIEDPVEYNLKGIAQISVRPNINLTFAAGLRTILRQDPDVIMIGEIRDTETAEIAIQAALTGHLVLSTLHTNDAPSAVTRLVDMGIEPYLISSSVLGVLAQRLVRKICPDCRQPYTPTKEELHEIGLTPQNLPQNTLWKGSGCPHCFHTGYKGRHGVYELMTLTPNLQQQLIKSADAVSLRHLALQEGLMTLRDHGAALVLQGITTISEVKVHLR